MARSGAVQRERRRRRGPGRALGRTGLLAAVAAVVVVAASLALGAAAGASPAAPAVPTADCTPTVVRMPPDFKPTVVCIAEDDPPDDPGNPGDDGDSGNSGDDGDDGCWWELYPIPEGVVPDRPPGVSPDAVMYWEICILPSGTQVVGPNGAQWFEPDMAPLMSPQEVATQVRVEIAKRLRHPVLVTDPAEGTPSVIDVPTFVAVGNWQGEQSESGCDPSGTVCVTLTATPTLTFDPGEPGAAEITCEPGGTRYDPAAGPPRAQAEADGACAHAYQHRTGVDGRPGAWPGVVTVTWAVQWEAGSGEGGDFAPIEMPEPLDRPVEEVQGVVAG